MLTVAKIGRGRSKYYLSLLKTDYYMAHATALDEEGVWCGTGAKECKLQGQVPAKVFRHLFQGYSPDGKKEWVYNAGLFKGTKRDRMPAYDLTFSAPKSVSVAWSIASPALRAAIAQAHKQAIQATLAEIEKLAVIRTGKGGRNREKADLIAAAFQHATARQIDRKTLPDQHLHTHVVLINTARTKEGKTGAINGLAFLNKTFAHTYGAMYRAELAKNLMALGFTMERRGAAYEIKGIPEALCQEQSKRSGQIEGEVNRSTATAKEKLKANHKTRQAKSEQDPQVILAHWAKIAAPYGITEEAIEKLCQKAKPETTKEEIKALLPETARTLEARVCVREAGASLAETQGVFTRKELTDKAFELSQSAGVGKDEIKLAVGHYLLREAVFIQAEEKTFVQKNGKEKSYKERQYATPLQDAARTRKQERADYELNEKLKNLARVADRVRQESQRVMVVTLGKKEAEAIMEVGLEAYPVTRLLADQKFRQETEKRKMEWTQKKAEWEETHLEQGHLSGWERRLYGEFKYATYQWTHAQKERYLAKEIEPTSKLKHAWLQATGRISKKQREWLDRKLEMQQRAVSEDTTVVVAAPTWTKKSDQLQSQFQSLEQVVKGQGGKIIFIDPLQITELEGTEMAIQPAPRVTLEQKEATAQPRQDENVRQQTKIATEEQHRRRLKLTP